MTTSMIHFLLNYADDHEGNRVIDPMLRSCSRQHRQRHGSVQGIERGSENCR